MTFTKTNYGANEAYAFDGGYIVKDPCYKVRSKTVSIHGWVVLDEDGWAFDGVTFGDLEDAKDYAMSVRG